MTVLLLKIQTKPFSNSLAKCIDVFAKQAIFSHFCNYSLLFTFLFISFKMKFAVPIKLFRSEIKKEKNKFLVDSSGKHYIRRHKEKKVKKIKEKIAFVPCSAMRLEDLKPCKIVPGIGNTNGLCYLHDLIHHILLRRFTLLAEELHPAEVYNDWMLVEFTREHFYQIFPPDPSVQRVLDFIPKKFWLNKHEIYEPPSIVDPANPNNIQRTCLALNLDNGIACGLPITWNSEYCVQHKRIKSTHAKYYHLSHWAEYLEKYLTFYRDNIRRDGKDASFIRTYLEFFLRVQHLQIFQIYSDSQLFRAREDDKRHFEFMGKLLGEMKEKYEKQLPAPLSVYRLMFKRFCAEEGYVKSNAVNFLKFIYYSFVLRWCEEIKP